MHDTIPSSVTRPTAVGRTAHPSPAGATAGATGGASATSRGTRRPSPSGTVLRRLFDEWDVIARRPSSVRRARSWDLGVEFDDLHGLVAAVGFRERPQRPDQQRWLTDGGDGGEGRGHEATTVSPSGDPADEVLGRLLVTARTDELAARVVLQRLLPGLCAAARRWTRSRPGGTEDAFDEIVSAAWVVIRVFPVERRPGQLAPKLLRDAEHQAFVKATRRKWSSEAMEPTTFDRRAASLDGERIDPADELTEIVDIARPCLSEYDLRLLLLLRSGRSMAEVASTLGVSVRTVSYHRDALVHRMRSALVA